MFVCLVADLYRGSVGQLVDFAVIAMFVALISKPHVSCSHASRYISSWSATLFDLIIIYLVRFLPRFTMDSVLASATTTTIIYGILDKVYVLLLLGKLLSYVNQSYVTNCIVKGFHVWNDSPINRSINLCGGSEGLIYVMNLTILFLLIYFKTFLFTHIHLNSSPCLAGVLILL